MTIRLLSVAVLLAAVLGKNVFADDSVDYSRDIRPVMSDTCFFCHGPDEKAREAGLRLDIRENALQAGDSGALPIVPGKPDESEIIRRIFAEDESERMPPVDSHKTLTDEQKQLFRRWVAEGATYKEHWTYVPLVRPAVPQLKERSSTQNPIDAFIQAPLEAKSVRLSPEADRRTLLRRVTLDLIGLPPQPSGVDAFVSDNSDAAYEEQVDRLLESQHFGERMAAWWLDVARFTDTVGFHGDQNQRIFPYRDYVIDAFNQNKPFNQFTVEQLAGDLLPNPTVEQLVATGFNRLNMMTREGGAQPKEYLAKYGADRARTVAISWLGATLGCAECHDHKFDPYSSRDFYSMQAFFADVKQWGVYADYKYTPNPELKDWTNEHPFPPELEVDSPYLQRRQARLIEQIMARWKSANESIQKDDDQRAAFDQWLAQTAEFLTKHPDGWQIPTANAQVVTSEKPVTKSAAEAPGDVKTRLKKQSAKGEELLRIELQSELPSIASLRLELLPDDQDVDAATPSLPRQMIRVTAAIKSAKGKYQPLKFAFADADHKEARYANTAEVIGIVDGWLTSAQHAEKKQTSVWFFESPVELKPGETLAVTIKADSQIVPVRLSVSPLASSDAAGLTQEKLTEILSRANLANEKFSAERAGAFLMATGRDAAAIAQFRKLQREIVACRQGRAWTMVTQAVEPLPIRVLPRGNWLDEGGEVVSPDVPHFLPQIDSGGRRLTRLDLAHWLCSQENPVTARNIMNRLWKQFFGNAISNVVDDLGAQGEPPSHPALLDWLAVEFRESGWNLKHMIKLIVMSKTYRQQSSLRPDVLRFDPNNRLLASQNPRRLDAEFVRDNALSIAELLNLDIGGPSAKPYQPAGYYANLQFPNREYEADQDDRQWRRGVYMHWQRTFLHPMLANFDAPGREECTANRIISNTPQQALTLLNDPTFVEAARAFAEQLLADGENDDARFELAYQRALSRSIKPKERESLSQFLAQQRDYFRANPTQAEQVAHIGFAPLGKSDPIERAAWTSVCRVILNLHETITRY